MNGHFKGFGSHGSDNRVAIRKHRCCNEIHCATDERNGKKICNHEKLRKGTEITVRNRSGEELAGNCQT